MDYTMTDRDLLKAAANTIGATYMAEHELTGYEEGYLLPGSAVVANPLLDDGDALRLAVALRLDLIFSSDGQVWAHGADSAEECVEPDPAAATRRAIVRAAA